jgi:hypothetical protein
MNALINTNFHFDGQTNVYHGKVRDVYTVKNDLLVISFWMQRLTLFQTGSWLVRIQW